MLELSPKMSEPRKKQPQQTTRSRPPQRAATMPEENPDTP